MNTPKRKSPRESPLDYTSTVAYRALSPVMTSMRLAGVYFVRNFHKPCSSCHIFGQAYCTLMLLLVTAVFVKGFFTYSHVDTYGTVLFSKIMNQAFYLEMFANVVLIYRAGLKYRLLPLLFVKWQELYPANSDDVDSHVNVLCKRFRIYTGIAWLVIIVNTTAEVALFLRTSLWDHVMEPVHEDAPYTFYVKIALCVLIAYTNMIWVLASLFLFSLALFLRYEFGGANNRLAAIQQSGIVEVEQVRQCRIVQEKLGDLVEHADRVVSTLLAIKLLTTIMMMCLMLYVVFYDKDIADNTVALVTIVVWVLVAAALLAFPLIAASWLNQQAHAAFNILHRLDLRGASQEVALEVTMFLSRLTGQPIGLTALNMFVVNKPTILTMFGMLITYFVLLLEFRPDDDVTIAQNCTMQ